MAVYRSMLRRSCPHNGSTGRYRFCCCLAWGRKQSKEPARDTDKGSCHQTMRAFCVSWPNSNGECGSGLYWSGRTAWFQNTSHVFEEIGANMGSKLSLRLGRESVPKTDADKKKKLMSALKAAFTLPNVSKMNTWNFATISACHQTERLGKAAVSSTSISPCLRCPKSEMLRGVSKVKNLEENGHAVRNAPELNGLQLLA